MSLSFCLSLSLIHGLQAEPYHWQQGDHTYLYAELQDTNTYRPALGFIR